MTEPTTIIDNNAPLRIRAEPRLSRFVRKVIKVPIQRIGCGHFGGSPIIKSNICPKITASICMMILLFYCRQHICNRASAGVFYIGDIFQPHHLMFYKVLSLLMSQASLWNPRMHGTRLLVSQQQAHYQ